LFRRKPRSARCDWHGLEARPFQDQAKISPDFELARIRDQIAELTPDMNNNLHRLATEMVAVETLELKVTDLQARLDQNKSDLAVIMNGIDKGVTRVVLNGREVPSRWSRAS